MTLQSALFDEDFKGGPTLLLWGDAQDMLNLRDYLRSLNSSRALSSLSSFCAPVDGKEIWAIPATDADLSGLFVGNERLEWRLDQRAAINFAELLEALSSVVAGHQFLDCPGDEVCVMASTGEYPLDLRP